MKELVLNFLLTFENENIYCILFKFKSLLGNKMWIKMTNGINCPNLENKVQKRMG